MNRKSWFLCCIVIAVISQNAQSDVGEAVTTSAEQSALSAFFLEPFEEPLGYSMVLNDAKARILSRFGKPTSMSSAQYPARTSDENLWNTTLEYSGITFIVGESEDRSGRELRVGLERGDPCVCHLATTPSGLEPDAHSFFYRV